MALGKKAASRAAGLIVQFVGTPGKARTLLEALDSNEVSKNSSYRRTMRRLRKALKVAKPKASAPKTLKSD